MKIKLKIMMAAMLSISVLFAYASFFSAEAAANVSPTDVTEQKSAEEVRTVTVTHKAPDLILSDQPGRNRGVSTKFKKFLPSVGYTGSYKSELDVNEKKLYEGLYHTFVEQRCSYTQEVNVTLDPPMTFDVVYSDVSGNIADDRDLVGIDDAVLSAAAAFFYDCPEAFWIRSFNYSMSIRFTKGSAAGTVDLVQFDFIQDAYPNAYDDLSAFDAGLSAAVESIKQTRKNQSVYETVKAIHDYIILNASYNYTAINGDEHTYGYAYTPTPLFVSRLNGLFVCEGYSKAMKILCNKFNINCALVAGEGYSSNTSHGPHMWNYVQIGGKWYGVDATWDDGFTRQDGTPYPVYNYFLIGSTTFVKNDKTFAQDHVNDGQVMSIALKCPLVFPTLSESAYDHYIVDTDPKIHLTTLGASIRITDPYGIRFGIQIKRDEGLESVHSIPEFGTLIIASGTLGNKELTINTPNVRKIRADNIFSEDESQYVYTGVLINIPDSFFGTKVKGRGYLIYIDDDTGEEHIIYSATVERSFYGVAQAAFESYSAIQNPDESQRAVIEKLKGFLGQD